ncbi:glycine betaine ABC transporter substrate-binding protein [Serpentinicella alkaliphila]|uniref:Osmoprotectant transport system substrate-binding protein n=1 Tax=Serpentinicella alkaliphila TaxID=1734049 RepID=A0A4R2U7H8_9FIRM|nr:glycine betaine ABC transporter substrate-binding protein [Serpentinicella alkaliphila]QUH24732.1 glycine/betaine ABC transporter substrate-binding protein [Serpentinicella alkaliphila]TCQ03723.1 osmoprotectant transport system substrate-binding protein [Serpentinicella alkaliphila]
MNFTKGKKIITVSLALVLLIFTIVGCSQKEDKITIGAKNFTESRLLATMFQVLIEEKTDLSVEVKEFGGTQLVFRALRGGDVDVYPEYTGTAYTVMLDLPAISDADETYNIVKQKFQEDYNLEWLGQLGFNNTYVLTVREEMANELNLDRFSDLIDHDEDMILGSTFEFLERSDGYPGLQEHYGFQFADTKGFDPGLTYSSLRNGHVDVIDAFSTDGRIKAFNLYPLEDDKQFFPPYYAAPLINGASLEKHPELREVLSLLEGKITDEEMRQLNYSIDEQGLTEEQVARDFLESKGLI